MRVFVPLVFIVVVIISISSLQTILAQNETTPQTTLQKMFNPANIQSNIYNDTTHNFSISPPDGWSIESQSNGTNDALVTFSNQNSQSLANFGIYYNIEKPIPEAVISLSDSEILNQVAPKLFNSSQFTILQKNIERFSDGFVIQVISEPKQNTQSTPISEWLLFWLDDGRQYFLILTSSQNNFIQNEAAFEKSATTFYVGSTNIPTVPEFGPVSVIVFTIMIFATLLLLKTRRFML